jgi:hypothetical protein
VCVHVRVLVRNLACVRAKQAAKCIHARAQAAWHLSHAMSQTGDSHDINAARQAETQVEACRDLCAWVAGRSCVATPLTIEAIEERWHTRAL